MLDVWIEQQRNEFDDILTFLSIRLFSINKQRQICARNVSDKRIGGFRNSRHSRISLIKVSHVSCAIALLILKRIVKYVLIKYHY